MSLKSTTKFIPPFIGIWLNYIPFDIRLGSDYGKYYKLCAKLLNADFGTKQKYVVSNFNTILNHFRLNNDFYSQLLQKSGFTLNELRNLEEISKIPILNKNLLRKVGISDRTVWGNALIPLNTGGTTGTPLSFYAEKNFYPREWAHIHYMWKKIGYKPTDTKVTIRGKSLQKNCVYEFNQNEFLIDTYKSYSYLEYLSLFRIFKKYNVQFMHGYPSSIYNFLKEISVQAPFLLEFLKKNIRGIMFGSEFPAPQYRDFIEDLLTKNTISWYGHTEGVILAGELFQKYEYVPLLSYGYTEAVEKDGYFHLVGTSFANFAAPFIRYDTEDLINPNLDKEGLLESFTIAEGRIGEFITDKNNKKISLTALIFGRHHKLFDNADFIQVRQDVPGAIIVYYSSATSIANPFELFDSSNLNLELLFQQVNEPFKTPLGKIPLLIK